jgi:hypothetical protein
VHRLTVAIALGCSFMFAFAAPAASASTIRWEQPTTNTPIDSHFEQGPNVRKRTQPQARAADAPISKDSHKRHHHRKPRHHRRQGRHHHRRFLAYAAARR